MVQSFVSGMAAYGRAFQMISRLRLWHFMLAPAIISILLALAILGTAWGISDELGRWLVSWYPWDTGKGTAEDIAGWLGAIAVVVLGLIVYKQLVMALVSPFMSPLSERIEAELRGEPSPVQFTAAQFLSDLWRGLRIALRNIIRELLLTVVLFLLGFIPVLAPFTTVLIFLVQSYYAGFGNIDYTLERHLQVKGSVAFVRRNRALALGNGVVYMGLLLTTFGYLLAIPLGAVAATLETVKKLPGGVE